MVFYKNGSLTPVCPQTGILRRWKTVKTVIAYICLIINPRLIGIHYLTAENT